jgi:hypothetical protein
MGKLKPLTFQGETIDGKRLVTQTIRSTTPDKAPTNIRQVPDKAPIIVPDKKSTEIQAESDFEGILTTCENNHVISKHGKTDTRIPILTANTPYEDTNEQWLAECDELF